MSDANRNLWKTPGPWLGLGMGIGTPIFMFIWASAGWPVALAVLVAAIIGAVFWLRSFDQADLVEAYGSPALVRYNLRFLVAVTAYAVGLMIAVTAYNRGGLSPLVSYAIVALPTVPALAMITIMARYLIEETDEYLRHRASLSAIIGLGFVLVIGTVWGFLETFGIVPHVWAWWVVPVWAIGLAIGQGILSRGANSQGEEA